MGREQDADSGKEQVESRERESGVDAGDDPARLSDPEPRTDTDAERCEVCGVPALVWRKCKLICENCGSVNKSCADL